MNQVIIDRIAEVSETRSRFHQLKKRVSDWKFVILVTVLTFTLKVGAEQLAMLFIRR
jgi:hypothetical protein